MPAHAAGRVDVTVARAGAPGQAQASVRFTYFGPAAAASSPGSSLRPFTRPGR
jgi:hypothetical protein